MKTQELTIIHTAKKDKTTYQPIDEVKNGFSLANKRADGSIFDYITLYIGEDFCLKMTIQDAINLKRKINDSINSVIKGYDR